MSTADKISDYLLTGMHHNTPEAKSAITKIIAENSFNYFITAIAHYPDKGPEYNSTRCFGYAESFEQANKWVLEDHCSLHESYYNYIVVESIKSGIHAMATEMQWYQWVIGETSRHWEKCDKPEFAKYVCNWSIG